MFLTISSIFFFSSAELQELFLGYLLRFIWEILQGLLYKFLEDFLRKLQQRFLRKLLLQFLEGFSSVLCNPKNSIKSFLKISTNDSHMFSSAFFQRNTLEFLQDFFRNFFKGSFCTASYDFSWKSFQGFLKNLFKHFFSNHTCRDFLINSSNNFCRKSFKDSLGNVFKSFFTIRSRIF